VDVRGGAPSASGTDVLRLGYESAIVDAVVIAGGSSYGLEAADGVRAELLASGKNGTRFTNVATIPAAIVFDFVGRENSVYPDKALGRAALRSARSGRFLQGAHGAGRFVTVGKYFGPKYRETSGQGGAFRQVGPTKMAVFTVVNAVGAIVGRDGKVVRGNRDPESRERTHVGDDLIQPAGANKHEAGREFLKSTTRGKPRENTTITLVVVNQTVSFWELQRLAIQVHTSMARAIEPFHTQNDGDVLFAVSTSEVENPALTGMDLATIVADLAWDAVLNSIPK
jgi:L-aminopeptidase/D-esterase-like protein